MFDFSAISDILVFLVFTYQILSIVPLNSITRVARLIALIKTRFSLNYINPGGKLLEKQYLYIKLSLLSINNVIHDLHLWKTNIFVLAIKTPTITMRLIYYIKNLYYQEVKQNYLFHTSCWKFSSNQM